MFCLDSKTKMQGTAVALGYFDGIHLGHRAVLMKALERAKIKKFAVYTCQKFYYCMPNR
mgnify:CR=1 FL=1